MHNNSFSFPQLPSIPGIPSIPSAPGLPVGEPEVNLSANPVAQQPGSGATVHSTFSNLLAQVSDEIQQPYTLATEMVSGKRPFDSTELVMAMTEAEHKLSVAVRVLNDLARAVKTLENIQA